MPLFRSLAAIFRPPFEGLALVVVLYIAWANLVYPHNDVLRGNLPDPDDYMYLTQTLDWIGGQSWYDNIQHRLNPPHGVLIHFSRFTELPLAAGILLLQKLGLPAQGAATLTALIEPLILFGLCLICLRKTAMSLVPASFAGASSYIALFSGGLTYLFMPGQVGHHGPIILMIILTLGLILRLVDRPQNTRTAAMVGILLACSMMLALESLPWVLLLLAWLGIWGLRHGGGAARTSCICAVSLLLCSIVCLVLTKPVVTLLTPDILVYSIVYVLLTIALMLPFVGVAFTADAPLLTRTFVGLVLAGLSGCTFLYYFPELMAGPYGGIDPQLKPLLLDVVEEAKPVLKTFNGTAHMLNYMSLDFIALFASLAFVGQGRNEEREKWLLITLLLATAIGLTFFYQYRFMGIENAFAVLPLTALLYRGWNWIGQTWSGRPRILAEIGLLLFVGPLPAVIMPALFDSRSFNTGMLLFTVDPGRSLCDMAKLETILRDPNGLGSQPHLILSGMGQGSELLFRTPHQVLAAPYHLDVEGNLDSARFFSTPYPDEAERIARRRGADLVLLCDAIPVLFLQTPGGAGLHDFAPHMAQLLIKGPVPAWLEPIPLPGVDNFILFRLRGQATTPDAYKPQIEKDLRK